LIGDLEETQVSDRKLIEEAISGFTAAYNSGDLDAVVNYYGDDLIKVRNGAPPETKADTARRIREVFEHFRSRVEVVTDEIQVHGEMAFTRGSFRVTLAPKAGDAQTQILDRRYLEIWHKNQGRWQVVRTMDNVR
jgi:ketosteroid isomerase-like protein